MCRYTVTRALYASVGIVRSAKGTRCFQAVHACVRPSVHDHVLKACEHDILLTACKNVTLLANKKWLCKN